VALAAHCSARCVCGRGGDLRTHSVGVWRGVVSAGPIDKTYHCDGWLSACARAGRILGRSVFGLCVDIGLFSCWHTRLAVVLLLCHCLYSCRWPALLGVCRAMFQQLWCPLVSCAACGALLMLPGPVGVQGQVVDSDREARLTCKPQGLGHPCSRVLGAGALQVSPSRGYFRRVGSRATRPDL
jgi:hypothetical protein